MKKLLVTTLITAPFVLAGCSSEKPGIPTPMPSSTTQGGATNAPPATAGVDPASIDACSLLTVADLAPFGTFEPPKPETLSGGFHGCSADKETETAAGALTIDIGIRDKQGIDSVNDGGNGKTTGNVNGRKAVLVPQPLACLMVLELHASARADIVVVASDTEKSCGIAKKVAEIVEPKLPKN